MKTPRPLISVILPVFNDAGTVGAAIRSILRQTVADLELIVIDDGSTDHSVEVVQSFRDPRLRFERNARNMGVAATRNRGLTLMRGQFMAPMDADDVCYATRLERTLAMLGDRPEVGVGGGWARWEGWGPLPFVHRLACGSKTVHASLLYTAPFHHDALLFRTSLLRDHDLRYPEHLKAAVDYDLYWNCARRMATDNVPAVLVRYRRNPRGISHRHAEAATARRLEGLRCGLCSLFPEDVSEDELRFHAAVGNGAGMPDLDALARARDWLVRIETANRRHRVYDPHGLTQATARSWFGVCRNSAHLGRAAWRAWRTSPWRAHLQPASGELAGFAASGLLARLIPSRRHPQGGLSGL